MSVISGLTTLVARGLRPPEATIESDGLTARLQELTAAIAGDERVWTAEIQAEVLAIFEERAATWSVRRTSAYLFPLVDALRRGGIGRGGICLEVGSGTGIQAVTLASHFDRALACDVSSAMLAHHVRGCSLLLAADGARLPVAPGRLDAIICVNSFLFPGEYAAALARDGAVVYVSTRAERTPIYLAPQTALAAMRDVDPTFAAINARAAQGCWTVLRRATSLSPR